MTRSLGFDHVWSDDEIPELSWDAVIDATNAVPVPVWTLELVEPGKRLVHLRLAGAPSLIDTRALALGGGTALGVLSASGGLQNHRGLRFGRGRPWPFVAATVGLDELAAVLGADGVNVVTVDLQQGADVRLDATGTATLAEAAASIGPVDILIDSAGIVGPAVPLLETDAAAWRKVIKGNVLGVVAATQAFAPGMVERGWGASSTSRARLARTATRTWRSAPPRRPR